MSNLNPKTTLEILDEIENRANEPDSTKRRIVCLQDLPRLTQALRVAIGQLDLIITTTGDDKLVAKNMLQKLESILRGEHVK